MSLLAKPFVSCLCHVGFVGPTVCMATILHIDVAKACAVVCGLVLQGRTVLLRCLAQGSFLPSTQPERQPNRGSRKFWLGVSASLETLDYYLEVPCRVTVTADALRWQQEARTSCDLTRQCPRVVDCLCLSVEQAPFPLPRPDTGRTPISEPRRSATVRNCCDSVELPRTDLHISA